MKPITPEYIERENKRFARHLKREIKMCDTLIKQHVANCNEALQSGNAELAKLYSKMAGHARELRFHDCNYLAKLQA